jgi:hypothetical protein
MRSMPKHVPSVQDHHENEQRDVDDRQVVREPLGQIQVGDGSGIGAQRLGQRRASAKNGPRDCPLAEANDLSGRLCVEDCH